MADAKKQAQGMAVAGRNYVAQDQIWKDHINHETSAAKTWPENWDFLTQKYTDVVKDEIPKREKPKIEPPIAMPQVQPISERVTVLPSPRPVPKTTSALIGWRSTEKQLALECYGGYAKPKGALVKRLNWPVEAID